MRRWIILSTGLLIVLLATNCNKGGTAEDDSGNHIVNFSDTLAPVIEITTPTPDQVYSSGNIINITGKLTDDLGLYRGSIRIINDANNSIIKEQLYEIHGLLLYNFNISHTASVTVPSDYTVTVSFEDHGLNETTKSVKIKVNP